MGHIFQTLRTLRAEGSKQLNETPLVAMVSYAIIHRQGTERFLREAVTAGFDGLIVPDLPVEESPHLARLASSLDLKLIQLITPTTPRTRARPVRQQPPRGSRGGRRRCPPPRRAPGSGACWPATGRRRGREFHVPCAPSASMPRATSW